MTRIIQTLLTLIALYPLFLCAEPPGNFSKAKKEVMLLFSDNPQTLYCGCRFDKKKHVDLKSCGMQQASHIKRARRVEIEHMMPAENFGRQFKCWREKLCKDRKGRAFKGRKCCKKMDKHFRQAEAELYNLWPAVGAINQQRSNYRYSPVEGKHNTFGCNFVADSKLRKAEPDDAVKGLVARANLFMADKYQVKLSKQQRKLFEAWNRMYPPTQREIQWAKRVAAKEGYSNPYIAGQATIANR
jgi:deoxyribonuclease I